MTPSPSLRLVLRSRRWLAVRFAGREAELVTRPNPFSAELVEAVVVDGDDATRFVTADDRDGAGHSSDKLFADAVWNLGRGEVVWLARAGSRPLFELVGENGYESSMVAIPGWLAAQARHVRGAPVVALPAHDTLWLADGADAEAVRELEALARERHATARVPLSTGLFTVDADARVVGL